MRLTVINQFYKPDLSPTANLAASLAEHRAAKGDQVTVIASRGGYVKESQDAGSSQDQNLRVRRIWTPQLGKASHLKRLTDYGCFYLGTAWRMLTMRRQDVIVCLTTPPMIAWTGVLHRLFRRKARVVLWNMDCYPEAAERYDVIREGGLASRGLRWMNRRLFKRLSDVVSLDHAMQNLLMSAYAPAKRPPQATVIPNWEPLTFFPADANPEPWQKAEELGLKDKFVVLYSGNMGVGHRFDTVLDAAEALQQEPVVFLFVGGGKRYDEIAEQAKARGLSNVVMHPYVKEKSETINVMASASCSLITLNDIALGVMSPSKVHANLARALPVIYVGPQGSNVDEAVQNHDCGVSLRHGQSDAIVAFVRQCMSQPDHHEALRTKAREAFDQSYNDVATLKQWDAVLDR